MRKRPVIFAPKASRDLADIEDMVAHSDFRSHNGSVYPRIFKACNALEIASERGHLREDIRSGVRVVGFERRLTIAFAVHADRVEILRLFRAGRDWEADLAED